MSSFDMVGRPWAAFFYVTLSRCCCIDVQMACFCDFYRLFFAQTITFATKVVAGCKNDEYG